MRIAAIVLAAGASTRMGGPNKLLLEVGGEPLVRRVVRAVAASKVAGVTVVIGHQYDRVALALQGVGVRVAFNPDHAQGQMTSVRRGLSAAGDADAYLIALADQAWLEAANVDRALDAFAHSGRDRILIPVRDGERGNPIVLPASARAEILSGGMNLGCRQFIARNPSRALVWATEDDGYFRDVDTPETYRALLDSLRERAPARAPA